MHTHHHPRPEPAEGRVDPFAQHDFGEFMDGMAGEAKAYWEAQKDYYALVASERAARASAGLMSGVLLALLLACVLAFFSVAVALWIGRRLGDMSLGFLIVGGFYAVVGGLFLLLWRKGYRDRFILRMVNALYHG